MHKVRGGNRPITSLRLLPLPPHTLPHLSVCLSASIPPPIRSLSPSLPFHVCVYVSVSVYVSVIVFPFSSRPLLSFTCWKCARFLREFDTSDRDPAKTTSALQRLEDTLRKLFVQGWIMVDPRREPCGDSAASQGEAWSHTQGSAKTFTQIIMEQLADVVEIRYGGKLKVL